MRVPSHCSESPLSLQSENGGGAVWVGRWEMRAVDALWWWGKMLQSERGWGPVDVAVRGGEVERGWGLLDVAVRDGGGRCRRQRRIKGVSGRGGAGWGGVKWWWWWGEFSYAACHRFRCGARRGGVVRNGGAPLRAVWRRLVAVSVTTNTLLAPAVTEGRRQRLGRELWGLNRGRRGAEAASWP